MGVAVLVVAMSAFSGFETTLKQAIIEVVGHVSVYKRGGRIDNVDEIKKEISKYAKDIVDEMRFLQQESLVSSKGKISAVLLNGIEKEKAQSLLNIKKRIDQGAVSWVEHEGLPPAYMGKELAKKLSLKIGDTFNVIFPRASKQSVSDLNPIVKKFYLVATIDLGKYEYNSRFLFIDLPLAQEILSTSAITGIRYKLKSASIAEAWARKVQEDIGWTYAAVDWRQQNKNYLSAIEYEKYVMFFVVLIILITACVNVTTSLFVLVLKKYRDISLYRTLGASPLMIVTLFCVHGLF